MIELAVGGYSRTDVINRLHSKNGSREINFRYNLLNKYEVKIGELCSTLPGNSITFDSLAEIKKVGNFNFKETELKEVDWLNDRVQPVFILKMPDGKSIQWSLGIFLLSSPIRKYDYGVWRDIEVYDTTLILKEDKFDNRYRIPTGTKYIDAITAILSSAGINKINITYSSGVISTDKEFEIGTTKLEVINQLLTEMNYTSIWVDAQGYFISKPYALPMFREIEYEYKTDKISVMYDNASNELDLFSIPNTWVVTASNPEKQPLMSKYINNLPTSKTSTVNRGRTIVEYTKVDDILDQSTLDAYTKRIAYNSSQIYEKFEFQTCCMPHHTYMDMLFVEYTNLGISSKFTETNWNMELHPGGIMNHSVRKVVNI